MICKCTKKKLHNQEKKYFYNFLQNIAYKKKLLYLCRINLQKHFFYLKKIKTS